MKCEGKSKSGRGELSTMHTQYDKSTAEYLLPNYGSLKEFGKTTFRSIFVAPKVISSQRDETRQDVKSQKCVSNFFESFSFLFGFTKFLFFPVFRCFKNIGEAKIHTDHPKLS